MLPVRVLVAAFAVCASAPPASAYGERVLARAEAHGGAAGAATPASSPSASPAAIDPHVVRSRGELDAWIAGKIDRSHYTDAANAQLNDGVVAQVSAQLAQLGAVKTFTQLRRMSQEGGGGSNGYAFKVEAEKPPVLEMLIGFDKDDKVAAIFFRPVSP